jgi:hypothetical protein
MNKRTVIIWSVALLLAIFALFVWPRLNSESAKSSSGEISQSQPPPIAPPAAPRTSATRAPPNPMQALLQTPILFYGIVLDQNGQPVPDAKVSTTKSNSCCLCMLFMHVYDSCCLSIWYLTDENEGARAQNSSCK